MDTTRAAAEEAYRDSETTAEQIQVAEVHDCFAVAEVLMYEALGFAGKGKGLDLIRNGTTRLDGRLPVNTGGGLLAFGHPVGATGVKQAVEIYRQMKGLCGDYQVPGRPEVGLTANMGGDDRTAVVTIYRN
jgi:acetyl-CoA acyltransferase